MCFEKLESQEILTDKSKKKHSSLRKALNKIYLKEEIMPSDPEYTT